MGLDEPILVSFAEAATILGVAEATVYDTVKKKQLNVFERRGRLGFFKLDDVIALKVRRDNQRNGTRKTIHQLLLETFPNQSSSGLTDRNWRVCYRYATTHDTYDAIANDEKRTRQRIEQIVSSSIKRLMKRAAEFELNAQPTGNHDELERRVTWLRQWIGIQPPSGHLAPKQICATTVVYQRDPRVKAWILNTAAGICELCGQPGPFERQNGEPYLETHHVIELSRGGADTVDNVVALCPTCHRRLHFSADATEQTDQLYSKVCRLHRSFAGNSK